MRIGDNIVNEFNEFSVNYTNDMIRCVPHYLKLIVSFIEGLPENFTPDTILDLGCGNGNVTSQVLKLFPRSNYVLLDASEEMISLCRGRFKGYPIAYVTSYFKNYEFPEEHFDMITAGFSLHHCNSEEKKILFEKIFGSLKPGGIFSCSDLMIDKGKPEHITLLQDWKTFVHQSFPDGEKWEWLMEHYSEFDKPDDWKDQIQWLQMAGFKDIEFKTKDGCWIHLSAIRD